MAKQRVRAETDIFLNDVQGSSSFQPQNLGATPYDNPAVREAVSREPSLTGAAQPYMPMTVAVPREDETRLEFTMLVNPENINVGRVHAVNLAYTRNGYVDQVWGPNQAVLIGTGKTAVFMVPSAGVTNFYKKQSFAFLNFMALVSAYRNNGYVLFDPTQDNTTAKLMETRVAHVVSGLELTYDGNEWMGHFSNFTIDESESSPFMFNYNFEFVASTSSFDYNEVRGHFVPMRKSRLSNSPLMADMRENIKNYHASNSRRAEETGIETSGFEGT